MRISAAAALAPLPDRRGHLGCLGHLVEAARQALDGASAAARKGSSGTRRPPTARAAALLRSQAYETFVSELPDRGISGGSVYDALVAATALSHAAELVTCDRRALGIYERYGVRALVIS